MPYKIPNLPGSQAYIEEKADFWEVQSIVKSGEFISQLNISRALSKEFDEIHHDGIESEEDVLESNLEDVFQQLRDRVNHCSNGYPFEFGRTSIKLGESEANSIKRDIYLYLLLCTRFNMKNHKVFNNVDATLLFEKLCAQVAKNYFGENAESIVFGTAEAGNFENKIKDLISKIGEGESFKNPNNNIPTKNDDGIDVVVWKEFADRRIGKLIGFAQCKTGTTWQDQIKKLKPSHFCENWLVEKPAFPPIPIVFICDTLNIEKNFVSDQRGLLLFNRFRIMEYLPENLDEELVLNIRRWLDGALKIVA
ncbi:hypothetical protein [uncultured Draconibacterium sp.]|uniref:hypothetical protein n=1 Tax=uncultured Draconibacterium sp. TaxID=1573823 RepID=UPI0029C6E574|nr:hypothetical protein [uncultured Draconibacterium sp.]